MDEWYRAPDSPETGTWWWAVEHLGHPAFYLRALMPGDFAPGRGPLPRHVVSLDGEQTARAARCGTCDEVPAAEDLDVIERVTGHRGFLRGFREHGQWPAATDPKSCWLCSARNRPADRQVAGPVGRVRVCSGCVAAMDRR